MRCAGRPIACASLCLSSLSLLAPGSGVAAGDDAGASGRAAEAADAAVEGAPIIGPAKELALALSSRRLTASNSTAGSVPSSWFDDTSRCRSSLAAQIGTGRVPVRRLAAAANTRKGVLKLGTSAGSEPVSLFALTSSTRMACPSTISGGSVPSSPLCARSSSARLLSAPRRGGIAPARRLCARLRASTAGHREAQSAGTSSSRLSPMALWLTFSSVSCVTSPEPPAAGWSAAATRTSLLSLRSISRRAGDASTPTGTSPPSALRCMRRRESRPSSPISAGKAPRNLFPDRSKRLRCRSLPMAGGTVPSSPAEGSSSDTTPAGIPSSGAASSSLGSARWQRTPAHAQ